MATTKPTILIVDPCSMTRQCMTVLLNARKYKAISAPSIRDALEIIKVDRPDLIIHELELPDGPATKLIKQARSTLSQAPAFFMLTSEFDQSRHTEVVEQRVVQVMIKREFTIKNFYSKVNALLGDKRHGKPMQINKKAAPAGAPRAVPAGPKVRSDQDREELYKSIPLLMGEEEVTECVESFAELQAMSPVASKVIELTGCDDATLETIAETIRTDPAIAAKLIRISNSAAFARPEPVTTPLEAVRRLGLKEIRQNVVNLEIMENFSETGTNTIDPRAFWEHSIAVGVASAMIAKETGAMDPELAYTAGLLHDVGRIILSQSLGEDYPEAIQFARENQLALDPIEQRMFGIDHASVMQGVLEKWEMSEELIAPIVHHHKGLSTIELDCPDRVEPVAIVSLADRLAHAMRLGSSGNLAVYPTEEYFAALSIKGDFLERISKELPNAVEDMRIAILGDAAAPGGTEGAGASADLCPQYISRHTESDAIRCWIDALGAEPGADEEQVRKPNLFVVRLRTKRDATEGEKEIKRLELKHALSGTPVIAISDSVTLDMPEVITSAREARLLMVPFTEDEFERCLRSIPELAPQATPESRAA